MDSLDFLGGAGGRSVGQAEENLHREDVEPQPNESRGEGGEDDRHSLGTVQL